MFIDKNLLDYLLDIWEYTNSTDVGRWITVHPHEDKEDYRRLFIKEGETVEQAIKRQFKGEKPKESRQDEIKKILDDKGHLKVSQGKDKKIKYSLVDKNNKEIELTKDEYNYAKELRGKTNIKPVEKKENKPQKETKTGSLKNKEIDTFIENKEKITKLSEEQQKVLKKAQEELEIAYKTDKEYLAIEKKLKDVEANRRNLAFSVLKGAYDESNKKRKELREKIFNKYGVNKPSVELNKLITDNIEAKSKIVDTLSKSMKDDLKKISPSHDVIVQKFEALKNEPYIKLQEEAEKQKQKYEETKAKTGQIDYYTEEGRNKARNLNTELRKYIELSNKLQFHTEEEVAFAQKVHEILKENNGVNLNIVGTNKGAMQEQRNNLEKVFNGVVSPDVFNNAPMNIKSTAGRAYHNFSTIHISADSSVSTAIHETMHHIEEHSPRVLLNSLAFAKLRTENEKTVSLKSIYPDVKYGRNEICKKDKFFSAYCGKLYVTNKKDGYAQSRASEIMSMGVQRLYENPIKFAKEDREYFDFVIANLKGNIY